MIACTQRERSPEQTSAPPAGQDRAVVPILTNIAATRPEVPKVANIWRPNSRTKPAGDVIARGSASICGVTVGARAELIPPIRQHAEPRRRECFAFRWVAGERYQVIELLSAYTHRIVTVVGDPLPVRSA